MIDTLLFFLPMILFLGAITSYEDSKESKIRNKWIVLAIIYAIVANIVLYIVYQSIGVQARPEYFIELLVTALLSLVVGFIIWWVGLWTAGDAKLYAAFSALLPLSVYTYGYFHNFASVNILINTVVPFFMYYTVIMIVKTTWKQKLHYIKMTLQTENTLGLLLFLFGFLWLLYSFYYFTGVGGNYFISLALLFIILFTLEKIFGENLIKVFVVIAVLRLLFDDRVLALASWVDLAYTFVGFLVLRFFILYMGYDYMTKRVDVSLLKEGMVPAEVIYRSGDKFHKRRYLHFSMLSYIQEKTRKRDYLFELTAEGLTPEDLEAIKKNSNDFTFEHLRIYKTLSFAPYLFIGVLLTILFTGNLFITLIVWLQ